MALGCVYTLEFESFFVILKKVAIPCGPNFMVALDTCFKSFTVLEIPFPMESLDLWMFIEHGIAGKPSEHRGRTVSIPPVVQAFIGQIMPRIC